MSETLPEYQGYQTAMRAIKESSIPYVEWLELRVKNQEQQLQATQAAAREVLDEVVLLHDDIPAKRALKKLADVLPQGEQE